MADQLFNLKTKVGAAAETISIVRNTVGIEDLSFFFSVQDIQGAGTTINVYIETTNVTDEDLRDDDTYWKELHHFTEVDENTVDEDILKQYIALSDLASAPTIPGYFIRVRIVIVGVSADVDYMVDWAYKERVTNS